MKLKYLLLSMLAAFALLSCAKEEGSNLDETKNAKGDAYIAVTFPQITRADGDFVAGETYEVAVNEIRFLFYDADGNQMADPYTVPKSAFSWNSPNDQDPDESIDEQSNRAILVLSGKANKSDVPASIVAIANPDDDLKAELTRGLTMTNLKKLYGNWADAEHTQTTGDGSFVMANSVYVNSNSEVEIGTPVSADQVYLTVEEANNAANPVVIHIEKNVAKVQVTNNIQSSTGILHGDDSIKFEMNKWWIDSDPTQAPLIKPLQTAYTSWTSSGWNWTGWNWNDAANFRSYWADKFSPAGTYQHRSVDDGVDAGNYLYANENATSVEDDYTNATKVVVEGTLKIGDQDAANLFYHQGTVYTEDEFKTVITNLVSSVYVKEGTNYRSINTDELDIQFKYTTAGDTVKLDGVPIHVYETLVQTKRKLSELTDTLYKKVGGEPQIITDTTEAFKPANFKVLYYRGGRTYYFFKITHNSVAQRTVTTTVDEQQVTVKNPLYGVIRNHLYKANLKYVTGLGTPLPQPDDFDFNPEIPEDNDTYIAAEIDILKYKEVDMGDITLGK